MARNECKACELCRAEIQRTASVIASLGGRQRRVCYACIDVLVRLRDEKSAARLYDALTYNGDSVAKDNSTK